MEMRNFFFFFLLYRWWACGIFTFDVVDLCLCYMNIDACEAFKIERTHSVVMWKIALLACTFSVYSFVVCIWTFFWRDRIKWGKAVAVKIGLLFDPLRCPRETVWSPDTVGSIFCIREFKSDLCNVKVGSKLLCLWCSIEMINLCRKIGCLRAHHSTYLTLYSKTLSLRTRYQIMSLICLRKTVRSKGFFKLRNV
jgi:hypothetical protein